MALRVPVCRVDDVVDGELRAFAVRGVTWPVIVVRVEGQIVATAGVCPHEDVGLADGTLEDCVLTCPGHGYRFDVRDGRCEHDATLALRRYPVTLVGDEVWVDLL
jgi:3-phenylpropionate/trans-cinnamate dioxygenase ferredoxin component